MGKLTGKLLVTSFLPVVLSGQDYFVNKTPVKAAQRLYLSGAIPMETYLRFKKLKKRRNLRPQYTRCPFNLMDFTDDECLHDFRFNRSEIEQLVDQLKIPKKCITHPKIRFSGIEGLCILLKRLSYPNRLNDLVKIFKRDASALSRIFNWMVFWMHSNFSSKVTILNQKYISREKLANMAESVSLAGSPYPNIIGFIDGTFRASCKPKYNQQEFYSGYVKEHGLKYQAITLPNGMIARLDGGFVARRHDSAIVHLSKLKDEMNEFLMNPDGTWYAIYGDAGYANSKFVKVGYKNHKRLTQRQKDFNALLSSLRVSVEYGFGGIIQQFAFVDFKKNQKVYLQPLKKQYMVAAFLRNCQCCLRGGNQISYIFECEPPTLDEYLS